MNEPERKPSQTKSQTDVAAFSRYKWNTFICMYVGYLMAIFSRKCFSFVLPAIIAEGHISKGELGMITSSQNLAYAISKFLGGLMVDHFSAKMLFSIGICISGFVVVSFTAFDSAAMFALLWFINGFVQGGSWPACAKMLKQWSERSEFGTLWGVLSTSMNVGCSMGPLVSTFITYQYGWRTTLQAFGTVTIATTAVCYLGMVNSPNDVGMKSPMGDAIKTDSGRGHGRGTWRDLVVSPLLWILSVNFMVIFIARTAVLDWAQLYLIQELDQTPYTASIFVSSFETGGIAGSVMAGYVADKMVAMRKGDDIRGSPRTTVCIAFILICLVSQGSLILIPQENAHVWITVVGFVLGVGIYGPCSLYGVMAIEAAPTHLAGAAHATVALAANVGAVMAGLPISYVATLIQWRGAFVLIEVLLAVILALTVLTRNLEYKIVATRKKLE
ncbi:Glucose-6-phosphate exchanger SLC37A4 [Lamellibrachia satsuma]|nr:Glucose-6-phosphate exchanger SLC37A4 [Lamellibrachia satsuma]